MKVKVEVEKLFTKACKDGIGTLYVLRCFSEYEESFLKIGITSRSVKSRYDSKHNMPYEYEVITELKSDCLSIWRLEKLNHKNLKQYRYKPNISFGGETECFTPDCLPHIKYTL